MHGSTCVLRCLAEANWPTEPFHALKSWCREFDSVPRHQSFHSFCSCELVLGRKVHFTGHLDELVGTLRQHFKSLGEHVGGTLMGGADPKALHHGQ